MGSCRTCGYPRVALHYDPAVPSKRPWKMSGHGGGSALLGWAALGRVELSSNSAGGFYSSQENLPVLLVVAALKLSSYCEGGEKGRGNRRFGANGRDGPAPGASGGS